MKRLYILFFLLFSSLFASDVYFISFYDTSEYALPKFRRAFNVIASIPSENNNPKALLKDRNLTANQNLAKIVVFNPYLCHEFVSKLPKEKLILWVWEPWIRPLSFYDDYDKVYTWDDTLVDNVKFFRFYYPHLMPFDGNDIAFKDKKLCVMVASNWVEHRMDILKFFQKKSPTELDCFGNRAPPLKRHSMYRGPIPGYHCGNQKINTLKQYRFCICFENTIGLQGYVSEKIFGCFAAGCVPVYWGAANIEKYIPKTCFIDRRDFQSNEELYQYLSSMSPERHQAYVEAIKAFLVSDEAQFFSPEYFDSLMLIFVSK